MSSAAASTFSLHDRITGVWGRRMVIGVPMLFLLAFFLLPFLVVFKISVSEMENVVFKDLLVWADGILQLKLKLGNYLYVAQDELYFTTYLSSLKYAAITTAICLVIAYPFAYFMARSPADKRPALLMLVMLPFWTSFLLRVYAWKMLLADNGVFNNFALWIGLASEPVKMMNTPFSLVLGMVYTYLPFMILPLYSVMRAIPAAHLRAASSLGAAPFTVFRRVFLPQTAAGVAAGSLLVFIQAIGYYVTPALVGGAEDQMISYFIAFYASRTINWGMAAALSILLVAATAALLLVYRRLAGAQIPKLG